MTRRLRSLLLAFAALVASVALDARASASTPRAVEHATAEAISFEVGPQDAPPDEVTRFDRRDTPRGHSDRRPHHGPDGVIPTADLDVGPCMTCAIESMVSTWIGGVTTTTSTRGPPALPASLRG